MTPRENLDDIASVAGLRRAPARQIVANAGAEGSVVAGRLLERGDANYGFDAQTGQYTDMIKSGIIDPTKVVRLALQGAASVASLLITTEVMAAEKSDRFSASMANGGVAAANF